MKRSFLICLLIGSITLGFAQSNLNNLKIPKEKIYLHQNSTFLMSGEYLFYKVYCLNGQTNNLTDFSKMAYVELIGSDGKVVFSHKIRLDKGKGQGDFFIPTSIASGNYKLVAFTQWMRNGSVEDFYQNDVVILNPFQTNQNGLLRASNDSLKLQNGPKPKSVDDQSKGLSFSLVVSQKDSQKRENITLKIDDLPENWYGNYSVSVRRTEDLGLPLRTSALGFEKLTQTATTNYTKGASEGSWLPELRGELISGVVLNKETGLPAANKKVGISIPGTNYLFKISSTKADGKFYFNLDRPYMNQEAIVQIVGDDRNDFQIKMDKSTSPDYSGLEFNDFVLTEEMKELILAHSIKNQVQNAYASTRVDSLKKIEDFPPFFSTPSHEYYLDDYTRFPTIRETILEVIEQATTRQKQGKQSIHVRVYDDNVETGLRSLLLIDGLFIQDHNTVVEAKAAKIKKMSVVSEQYLYGSEVFEGIIAMESFDGDFIESLPQLKGQETPLFRPEAQKEYYHQDYKYPERYKRIPDFRTQLVWEPEFDLTKKNNEYSFYTSDISGSYEVIIEGFNKKGRALSLRQVFEVK